MPTPGYVFKDGGPVPDCDMDKSTQQQEEQDKAQASGMDAATRTSTTSNSSNEMKIATPTSSTEGGHPLHSGATDSHALAVAEHDEKGAVQKNTQQYADEVRDMGWHEEPKDVAKPLVGGLPNEELWMLVRRFDKQTYHLKSTNAPLLGGLDVNIVDEDEFSPDKLRSNVERLYMTVIIGVMAFGKHVARLRSWREPRRTGIFCAAYFVAWALNLLMPLILMTLIALIIYPPSRGILFPPAPIALVSSKTGGVQTPKAGVLGSHDSATGAPENHKGEAVEQEAHNFVSGIGTIALSSAVGKHEEGDPESDPVNESVPDPTAVASAGAAAKASAGGAKPTAKHDKTKQPMEDALWKQMRPIMHVIGDLADTWERFANALSPTKPFPQQRPRMILASVVMPLLGVSIVTTSAMFMKATTAGFGFAFFSDPLLWKALDFLNRKYPNWQKLLELRNSILKGVPTNAQLTITLLRIGEANKAPLPPPPRSDEPPSSRPASIHEDQLTLDTNKAELENAIHKSDADRKSEAEYMQKDKQKHQHGQRILGFFKGTTNAGVETKFGVDKARAHVLGSEDAKDHLGILPKDTETLSSGPVDFKSRYKGNKGFVFITTKTLTPTVSFSNESTDATGTLASNKEPIWSINIEDIQELKKVGGVGWKAKIVVGWATGKQVADGLEIITKDGKKYKVTAVRLREELFNRLVSIGSQKWECW